LGFIENQMAKSKKASGMTAKELNGSDF